MADKCRMCGRTSPAGAEICDCRKMRDGLLGPIAAGWITDEELTLSDDCLRQGATTVLTFAEDIVAEAKRRDREG
jgi:hypothetical protein